MKYLKQYTSMVLGAFLIAAAVAIFYAPNKIVSGGVSGISTILYHTLSIPLGVSYAVINIALLLMGFKVLGKDFTIKTLISTALLSIFTEVLSVVKIDLDNIMLSTIFGGVMYGFGLAITFMVGSTTGGTDIIGRLVQYKMPAFSIGNLLFAIDGLVILSSFIAFGKLELVLLGIIGLFLQTTSLDMFIKRLNVSKMAFVISNIGDKICHHLVSNSPRGVTIIDVVGGYTMEEKKLLLCALKQSEIDEFQKRVMSIDPEAFVIFSESQYIMGNGFMFYR